MYANKNLKVTVIDDEASMGEMVKDFVSGKFPTAEITVFQTGEAALEGVFPQPDIIVLDYHLDNVKADAMNGIQVLVRLKERFGEVPVIFLSGMENPEVAANTIKYGAYDYIVKGTSAFQKLEIVMNNLLGQQQLKKNLGSQKFFNYLLAALLATLVVGMIIAKVLN